VIIVARNGNTDFAVEDSIVSGINRSHSKSFALGSLKKERAGRKSPRFLGFKAHQEFGVASRFL
jgi:hypothetical protein